MRALVALVVASLLIMTGCVANTYQIPQQQLQQLAATPPEVRGEKVRVIQEIGSGTEAPTAQPVTSETQIILIPQITIGHERHYGRRGGGGGFGRVGRGGGGGGGGSSGSDSKAAAIAFLVIAAGALVAIAAVEGSRFDGWAQLHPMHPVHLFGHDGSYSVMPLAALDAETVAQTRKAVVRPTEGPWQQLSRAPLHRTGPTYSMYGGAASLRSASGELGLGPAFTVQAGYFPTQEIGILGSVFLGWRENRDLDTLFESRYTFELQALPVAAGPIHAGLYGGIGGAYRFEDGVNGNSGSGAFTGGTMLQLDVNTRIALTARAGLTYAHDETMREILVGMSVY